MWHSLGLEDLAQAWRSTRSEITVHGEAEVKGDTRQHGMSKDGGIRRQVMLSLVQTADYLR